jgi:HK97 family phage portal protein
VGLRENILRSAVEQRVIGGVPWRPWDSPYMRYDVGGPVHPTRAFYGPDDALGLPAFYAGVKLLSFNAASLPIRVYQHLDGGASHMRWLGPTFFDRPSAIDTPFDWMSTLMASVQVQGNAWGFITGKDSYGYPTGIEWVPPQDVHVIEPEDQQTWNPMRAKVFFWGREVVWYGPDAEVFHIKGLPMPGRIEGISPLRAFALTLLAGKEAQQYGTSWYEAGGFPPGTFQNSEIEIDAEAAAEIRQSLVTSLRRREPLVYGRDWDYKPVTVPPSEAQFIDAMQLNATQIAAILNLPPDRLGGTRGDSMTYNTVVQANLEIIESLRPWLVKFEQSFFDLLPRKRFTKFYTDELLKTDLLQRVQIYEIMRNIGIKTADEIRLELDMEPLKGGIGDEGLPLTLMNAMGTRAGAIPKSLLKAVVLEMDVATDRLIKLEKTLIATGKLPQGTAPGGMGGGMGGGGAAGGGSPAGRANPSGSAVNTNHTHPAPPAPPPPPPGGFNAQTGQPFFPQGMEPIGRPNAPLPLAQDPASFLASLISVQRDMSMPYEVREQAKNIATEISQIWDRVKSEDGPDSDVPASDMKAHWMKNNHDVEDQVNDDPKRGHL